MEKLELFLEKVSGIIWGNYLIISLIGVGVFFTILTNFIQFKGFPLAFKEMFNSLKKKDEKIGEGTISSFQALCTALSSCVGNGNIVGVATAIASGGPGAIFWMWVAGILGMATKYAEIVLGIIYREKSDDGSYVGGPMYYISKGLGWKKISIIFSILMLIQVSGGCLIQTNAVAIVAEDIFKLPKYITGVALFFIVGIIIMGGIKRLANIAEKIIPIMASIYFIGGLIIIVLNYNQIIPSFLNIIKGAFNFNSVGGGVAGYSVRQALRYGISRGLYSNEAGEGSAPVLHSAAITDHPSRQGLYGILEVFIDTVVICSLTAMIVLTSGVTEMSISPAIFVMVAFSKIHYLFKYVIGISMILFAFSSIISQWYFGNVTLTYIFDSKRANYFKYIFIWFTFLGALSSLKVVWLIQDIVLGIMIIPNLIAIVLLSKQVRKSTKNFLKIKGENYVSK